MYLMDFKNLGDRETNQFLFLFENKFLFFKIINECEPICTWHGMATNSIMCHNFLKTTKYNVQYVRYIVHTMFVPYYVITLNFNQLK